MLSRVSFLFPGGHLKVPCYFSVGIVGFGLCFLDRLSGVYMEMFIAVVELMSSTYLKFHEHCRTWRNSVAQQPQDHSSRCRKNA